MAAKKHIVLIPFPAQGHVLPMIYLARKIAANGVAVTIINIDSIHDNVEKNWKQIPGQDVRLESIPMSVKLPNGIDGNTMKSAAVAFADAVYALEDPLAALLDKISSDRPVSCVVSSFFHFAAANAVVRVGLQCVCFWSGAAAWASIQFSHFSLVDAGLIPVKDSNANELVTSLPGFENKPFKAKHLPLYYYEKEVEKRKGTSRDFQSTAGKRMQMDSWTILNSFYELEPEVFDAVQRIISAGPGKFVPIGPLFPLKEDDHNELEASLRTEDRASLDWLDSQAPKAVLYISFGSIASFTSAEFKTLVEGVEASKQPFLMVASQQLVSDALDNEFFDRFVESTTRSGTGKVVNWAPQLAVLRHDAVGGFLTHCGWNSTLEGLSNGVPMLGWPRFADQNVNCKLILRRKGIGMELRDRSSDGVCQAIIDLMNNETVRFRALEIQKAAREATSQFGSSYKNFQHFLSSV